MLRINSAEGTAQNDVLEKRSLCPCEVYIIPTPFDSRILLWESPAVAQAAMETGVARRKVDIAELGVHKKT